MLSTEQIEKVKETIRPRIKVRQLKKGMYRINHNNNITYIKNES